MTEPETEENKKETDLLVYQGSSFPRILRLAWTLVVVFMIWYLAAYMWPDLRQWIKKM